MNLCLLYGRGQVHGVQGAGVVIATCPREGEGDDWSLLSRRQEVKEAEPHRAVLQAGNADRDVQRKTCEHKDGRVEGTDRRG